MQFKSVYTKENLENIPNKGRSPYPNMPKIQVTEQGVHGFLLGESFYLFVSLPIFQVITFFGLVCLTFLVCKFSYVCICPGIGEHKLLKHIKPHKVTGPDKIQGRFF
jgi:hypothetical protein